MSVIIEPLITEKTVNLSSKGKYVFIVDKKATKNEIKKEIARLFKVKAEKVNILIKHSKQKRVGRIVGRIPSAKKAIVTIEKGKTIKELETKG